MAGVLTLHMVVGLMLIPPVLVKLGSTGCRCFRGANEIPGIRAKRSSRPARATANQTSVLRAPFAPKPGTLRNSDAARDRCRHPPAAWLASPAGHVCRAVARRRPDRACGGL